MSIKEELLNSQIEYVKNFAERSKSECMNKINKHNQSIERLDEEVEELGEKVKKLSKSIKRLNKRIDQLDEQLNKDSKKLNINHVNDEETKVEVGSISKDDLSKLIKEFIQIVKDC